MTAVEHFKNLIKIDTTNPPGREMAAILYLKRVLEGAGLQVFIQETAAERGNLVVRIKGSGEKKPILISSHVDVVHSEKEHWKHDPFSAAEDDGCIYGRGTVDMKNFTAMCLATVLAAKNEGWKLKRDIIMSAVSDEETGGRFGMERLVNEHPDLVRAEYALGEVGGYTTYIGGKAFYPIQVGEKGRYWIDVFFRGEPGHGSVPNKENAHWRLGRFIKRLEDGVMPFHPTRSLFEFIDGVRSQRGLAGLPMALLKTPLAPRLLKKKVFGPGGDGKTAGLLAMMTNTVNPTGTSSGRQINVVPSVVTLRLDCRIIPGLRPESVVPEIERLTGEKLEYEIVNSSPGHESPIDTDFFRLMKRNTEAAHPGAIAVPWLTVGYTDAGYLHRLGNICYGFTPIRLGPELDFTKLYHGHNERVPVDGFIWGTKLFMDTMKEFACS